MPSRLFRTLISRPIPSLFLALWWLPLLLYPPTATLAAQLRDGRVIRVTDGDGVELIMEGKAYRTRLIGIDAPEMGQEPWGKRSRDHLKSQLKKNQWRVTIETDIVERDKYRRLLVYLRTPDGEMLNERQLKDGYAVLFTIQPNSRYVERFTRAQTDAHEHQRGIWGSDGLTEPPSEYKKTHKRK